MPSKIPKPPHPGDLIKTIRKLAAQGKITFTSHAVDERMEERGFDVDDVVNTPPPERRWLQITA
jgi:hypothetical protein